MPYVRCVPEPFVFALSLPVSGIAEELVLLKGGEAFTVDTALRRGWIYQKGCPFSPLTGYKRGCIPVSLFVPPLNFWGMFLVSLPFVTL